MSVVGTEQFSLSFLSSLWNLTVAAVILFVSCLDPVVRKSDSDDGMGLQAFSHQNEWR